MTTDDLPPDPNAAITAAIAADDSRALAMAIVDRVQVLIGNQQLRSQDEREEVYKAITDIRLKLTESNTARERNHAQLVEFFTRLFGEFDMLKKDVAEIVGRVDIHEERLNAKQKRMAALEGRLTVLENRLNARPTPEQAKATYKAIRWIVEDRGGDPDALGLPKLEGGE